MRHCSTASAVWKERRSIFDDESPEALRLLDQSRWYLDRARGSSSILQSLGLRLRLCDCNTVGWESSVIPELIRNGFRSPSRLDRLRNCVAASELSRRV